MKKSNDKLYWYGVQGQLLAESDASGAVVEESDYYPFGGERVVVLPGIWTTGQGKICGVGPTTGGDDDAETTPCSVQGEGGNGGDAPGQTDERTAQAVWATANAGRAVEESGDGSGSVGGTSFRPTASRRAANNNAICPLR